LHLIEHRQGERLTFIPKSHISSDRIAEIRAWQEYTKTGKLEQRVGEVGDLGAQIQSLTTPGAFVPIKFLERIFAALKQYDAVFNPELVSYVETTKGGVLQIPYESDLGNDASPVDESAHATDADLTVTGHAQTFPKSYKAPFAKISIEARQDIEQWDVQLDRWEKRAALRVARGVGRDILIGSGSGGHILGLIPQLLATGYQPIIAAGSSENTGTGETGANSIGTRDLARLYTSIDAAYRTSPKAAFLVNDSTLGYLLGLVDKVGRPIVSMETGYPTIFGKQVLISPSLDSFGPSKQPVLFGAFDYLVVHCAKDGGYVRRYDQAPGYAEAGVIGYKLFSRHDAALVWNDSNHQNAPIGILQNAS
jgi:HK97 family phage major capsid protein